jgi:uncharacterized protein (TIRG00374 family)
MASTRLRGLFGRGKDEVATSPLSAAEVGSADERTKRAGIHRKIIVRVFLLLVTAVSLYLLFPSLLEVFSSWRQLLDLSPYWVAGMVLFEIASFFCIWALQRTAMRAKLWRPVIESQLAGNAFGRIVPGGMATAGALQYQMLTRAGIPPAAIASGLASSTVIQFAALLALPILAVPAIIGGTPVDNSLEEAVWIGGIVFVLMAAAGFVFFRYDRPLELVARAAEWVLNRLRPRRPPTTGLAPKLKTERDEMAKTFGNRWWEAVLTSVGKWAFDYLALLAAIGAVGAKANPSIVLIAYVVSCFLGMIPLTPGGLGFVEAGLTGTLAVAGVPGGQAVVATLAYRLVSFWLPIPAGGVAAIVHRRRYGTAAVEERASAGGG